MLGLLGLVMAARSSRLLLTARSSGAGTDCLVIWGYDYKVI